MKDIKKDLVVQDKIIVQDKIVSTSINDVIPDVNGNINLIVNDVFDNVITGNIILFDENNEPLPDFFSESARIIDTDDELAQDKLITTGLTKIYDARTGAVWIYTTVWAISAGASMYDDLPSGYLYSNPNTKRVFFINPDNTVNAIAGHSAGTGLNQLPKMSDFMSSISASKQGYQKLPNGFIMQWVQGNSDATGRLTVAFPIPFPNAVLGGIAEEGVPTGWSTTNVTVWGFNQQLTTLTTCVADTRTVAATGVTSSAGITGKVLVWGY